MQMHYDEPAYFLHSSRDSREYDMATALDITPVPFSRQFTAEHYQGFASPLSQSMLQIDPFGSSSSLSSFSSSTFATSLSEPELCHPVPRRPVSPGMFSTDAEAWRERKPSVAFSDLSTGRSSFSDFSDGGSHSSFSVESLHEPSMFALSAEVESMQTDIDLPPPPPSWAMSGSLDPATGIYQTAPEHPRVRTQQACEKCRGRKAKCSGERPCQRCCTRGLVCEYAPERKMRGPNKVKRKGQSKDRSSRPSRRASVASTVSDDDFDSSSPRARVDTAPRQFTMQFDVPPPVDGRASGSSGSLSATPSPRSEHSYSSPSREQLRPPPISLAGTGLYDHARLPLPHDVPPFGFDAQSPSGLRRASLPAYILEHQLRRADAAGRMSFDHSVYAPPRGLDAVENTPRPRSSPAFPLLSPFAEAPPSACSSSGASPRTPLELTYPVDDFSSAAAPPGFTPDFASFARFDGPAGWLGGDADATPTLGADGDGSKAFPPYVHSEFISESPE